jgi:asparagine synthase (glutamine-hydrolysing)
VYADTFPWSKSIEARESLLSKDLKHLKLRDYIDEAYKNTIKNVPHPENETTYEHKMRDLYMLNIKWFMLTLLNRKDRMTMSNSLEVRVPFADYRIVEYAFNIPPEIKLYNGREKGLLREALRGILPEDIVNRKKSPYPKTHNPKYTKYVQDIIKLILEDKDSPLLTLVDKATLITLNETGGTSIKTPWYGQLMKGPQLLAYLIQIDMWMREYRVKVEL